jgi:hypothetical protein
LIVTNAAASAAALHDLAERRRPQTLFGSSRWLQFLQQGSAPRRSCGQLYLEIAKILDKREIPDLRVHIRREIAIEVPHAKVPTHGAVAHAQEIGQWLQRGGPESIHGFDVLAAQKSRPPGRCSAR